MARTRNRVRSPSPSYREPSKKMKRFSQTQTNVSMTLVKQVFSMKKAQGENVVFSPISIHVILGVMAAAFGPGKCRDEVLTYLKSDSCEEFTALLLELVLLLFADGSSRGGPRLSFANGMWIDQSLSVKKAFEHVVKSVYKAGIETVDFCTKTQEACDEVNAWVEQETNGLIKNLVTLKHVDWSTRLIFANAVYFKGEWEEKFDASETRDCNFFLLNGEVIRAPFIRSKKKKLISAFDGFKVLKLPYKQGKDMRQYSMYIYLPDAKDGLTNLIERFCSESGFIDKYVPRKTVIVNKFRFPKFKTCFGFEARKVLKKSGMSSAVNGCLPEIAENLDISNILHKSFVEVNEEGTEAAAATAMIAGISMSRGRPNYKVMDFVADHPFIFIIREDRTGMVLFVGQVLNPLIEK